MSIFNYLTENTSLNIIQNIIWELHKIIDKNINNKLHYEGFFDILNRDRIKNYIIKANNKKLENMAFAIYSYYEYNSEIINIIKKCILESKIFGDYISTNKELLHFRKDNGIVNIIYFNNYNEFIDKFDKDSFKEKLAIFENNIKDKMSSIIKANKSDYKIIDKVKKLCSEEKFSEAKKVIESLSDNKIINICNQEYEKIYKKYEDKISKTKPVIDKNGKTILVYNSKYESHVYVNKYNGIDIIIQNELTPESISLISKNLNNDIKILDKCIKSDFNKLSKELIEEYLKELESFIDKNQIKSKYSDINKLISNCELYKEYPIYYNPESRIFYFYIYIQLIDDYTGVAKCMCYIIDGNFASFIDDIYCD